MRVIAAWGLAGVLGGCAASAPAAPAPANRVAAPAANDDPDVRLMSQWDGEPGVRTRGGLVGVYGDATAATAARNRLMADYCEGQKVWVEADTQVPAVAEPDRPLPAPGATMRRIEFYCF